MKILLLMIISLSLWANIGNIMAIKGSADVKRASELLNATNGMLLQEGDVIQTHKKSRVQVMLKDDTVVTIGAKASFGFEEFNFDKTKDSTVTMRANRGFFRSVTGKIGKIAPERFKVKTSSATIGIRGTDFSGEILEGREVIKCYTGVITVEFDGEMNEIEAGMMMEIVQDKVEIKVFDTAKVIKTLNKNINVLKKIVLESLDTADIPISVEDIVKLIDDIETKLLLLDEPFTITPSTEDREQQGY